MRNPHLFPVPVPVATAVAASVAATVCLLAAAIALPPQFRADAAEDEATLRGVASGGAGPAADAEVAAGIIGWAPAAGDHVAVATTDGEGRFTLARAPLGPIDVWVRPRGGAWTFSIRMWHPGVSDLAIDARARPGFPGMDGHGFGSERSGTVTGVVTDKQAKPIPRAAVGLRGDDSTWVLTDDKGQFTLDKAEDGDGLVVRVGGFRDSLGKVKLDKKRMTIKLDPAKATVVHVDDPAGKPLPGAWVTLGDPDTVQSTTGFASLFPPRARLVGAWTDEKGDARIAWGDPDDATVATAYAPRCAPASKKVSAAKGPVKLQLAAPQPARATVVSKADGTPLAGVYVGLPHQSDGGDDSISALPQDAERGPVVVGRTDENGQCVIAHLPADVETLRVVGEHKLHAVVRVERMKGDEGK
ncbi:MAG: carboxypeptidase-like regulatory domain-containing protein [Planctomycetes bacterium]|nr:carboxypeptidase-like regulatory domain-containing protein [Planctomycetota bacterium]